MENSEETSFDTNFLSQFGRIKSQASLRAAFDEVDQGSVIERIWKRDPGLWKAEENHQEIIRRSLGWLNAPATLLGQVKDLVAFAEEVRTEGFEQVVVLGMGGSSLCPEVLRETFESAPGFPKLLVLDSTDPDSVREIEGSAALDRTLFVVASKSGTTTEPLMLFRFFHHRVAGLGSADPGSHFIAITDPGTPLEKLAKEEGFRRVFLNMPDIGGRFSALSFFGMVPAALMGLDIEEFLGRAVEVSESCREVLAAEKNPGASLGAGLAALAQGGRNKLTLVLPPPIHSLDLWIEQLIAESTGKEERGLLPVAGEPLGPPDVYGEDRVFVYVRTEGTTDEETERKLDRLEEAGHPVIRRRIESPLSLGGEFFIWEFATAVAGVVMRINPFDQPNVTESKDNTLRLLDVYHSTRRLPEPEPLLLQGELTVFGDSGLRALIETEKSSLSNCMAAHLSRVKEGDYVALTGYLHETPVTNQLLSRVRNLIRDRLKAATTIGYGPRFLHSTGQFHKGGPDSGLFVQITASGGEDLPIPGQEHSFGVLEQAQALGDFEALAGRSRRLLRLEIGSDVEAGLLRLYEAVEEALDAG